MGVDLHHQYQSRHGYSASTASAKTTMQSCLAIGAWKSTGVGCKGEDAEGVIGGIDFLRKVVRNERDQASARKLPSSAAETLLWTHAGPPSDSVPKKVYNIYRRTKDEMPADHGRDRRGRRRRRYLQKPDQPVWKICQGRRTAHVKQDDPSGNGTGRT